MNGIKPIIVLGLVAVWISGCTTAASLRNNTTAVEYKSSLPAKKIAICIADRWENTPAIYGSPSVSMRPIEDGYAVSRIRDTSVFSLADIRDLSKGGSFTKYYENPHTYSWNYGEDVKGCQNAPATKGPQDKRKY